MGTDYPALVLQATAETLGRSDLLPIARTFEVITPDVIRREFQKARANAIPILIIDEFDKLVDDEARELCAHVIKYLYDYTVNVTIILVGVAESVDQLISDHESIRRSLTQIQLERMSPVELKEIITSRLSKTPMAMEPTAIDTIVTISRGLPYFTQMLAKFAAQVAIDARRLLVTVSDVDASMDRFILEEDQTFKEQYRLAIESNQPDNLFTEVLLACALARTDDSGFFTMTDVIQPLTAIANEKKTHSHFQRHLSEFLTAKRGPVLERRGAARQYRYRFKDPMMQPYVIVKGLQSKLIPQTSRSSLIQTSQLSLAIGT